MTIEIRDASLEAGIRKQLQATGSNSVEEVLLRSKPSQLCHPERSDCFALREAAAQSKDPIPAGSGISPERSFHHYSRLSGENPGRAIGRVARFSRPAPRKRGCPMFRVLCETWDSTVPSLWALLRVHGFESELCFAGNFGVPQMLPALR